MNETIGSYKILQECGRGSYGVVYLAQSTISGQRVALKVLSGQQQARELDGLIRYRECRHANLLQIHHIDRLPDGRLYYTMDAADDRGTDGKYAPDTLAARGRIKAAELIPMLSALLDGVTALHKRKLIHRDIKPENILFVNQIPVLGDVGLTAPIGNASMVGTPSFLPPDVLAGARPPDEKSDLYALGRVAYTVLTGFPPGKYPRIPKDLPREAAPILAFCRAANAKDATIASCRKALNAPPHRSTRPAWLTLAALLLAAVAAIAVLRPGFRNRTTSTPATAETQALPTEESGQPTESGLDAERPTLANEMMRKMRQLTREEYLAAVEELKRRYRVPEEILSRAKVRYETALQKYLAKKQEISPFTVEGAMQLNALDDEEAHLEEKDLLYRIGKLSSDLDFWIRAALTTRNGFDIERIEKLFQARQDAVRQLTQMPDHKN